MVPSFVSQYGYAVSTSNQVSNIWRPRQHLGTCAPGHMVNIWGPVSPITRSTFGATSPGHTHVANIWGPVPPGHMVNLRTRAPVNIWGPVCPVTQSTFGNMCSYSCGEGTYAHGGQRFGTHAPSHTDSASSNLLETGLRDHLRRLKFYKHYQS